MVREGGQKVLFPRVVTIGAKAVLAKYQQVSTLLSDGEGAAVSMADLQPLKTYGWVLSEAQVEQVRKWLGIVAARLGGGFGEACIQDKADGGHASASVAAGGANSASSSVASSSAGPVTKKARAAEAKTANVHANMLCFLRRHHSRLSLLIRFGPGSRT